MLTILYGDDEQSILKKKKDSLEGKEYLVVDCAEDEDGVLDALRSPSLFGPPRTIWAINFQALNEKTLAAINQAAVAKAIVVARAEQVTPKMKNLLPNAAFINLTLPKGRNATTHALEMIKNSGLRISAPVRSLLVERTMQDTSRLSSILLQCKLAGLNSPTIAQIEALIGSTRTAPTPWEITDLLESAKIKEALAKSTEVNPIAFISYYTPRVITAGRILEADATSDQSRKERARSGVQKFQVGKVEKIAHKLGSVKVKEMLNLLAKADADIKVKGQSEERFQLLLLEMNDLLNG